MNNADQDNVHVFVQIESTIRKVFIEFIFMYQMYASNESSVHLHSSDYRQIFA